MKMCMGISTERVMQIVAAGKNKTDFHFILIS